MEFATGPNGTDVLPRSAGELNDYVDAVRGQCLDHGDRVMVDRLNYQTGVIVGPLEWEADEFEGMWLVSFAILYDHKRIVRRVFLGQATVARVWYDLGDGARHPEGIRYPAALARYADFVAALDRWYGEHLISIVPVRGWFDSEDLWDRVWPVFPPSKVAA